MWETSVNKLDKPLTFTIILLLLMGLGMLFIRTVNPQYYKIIEFGITKIYIFPLGLFCGYLSFNKIAISNHKLFAFIMLCIVLYLFGINQAVTRTLVGIPVVCLCIDYVFKDRNNKILVCLSWLGKYSLELYLLHVLIYFTFWQIIGLNDAVSMFVGIIISLLVCSPISFLVKKIV